MKKIVVSLIIIIVILIGTVAIIFLLNQKDENNQITTTKVIEKNSGYNLLENDDSFKLYEFSDSVNDLLVSNDNFEIQYIDRKLFINKELIGDNITLFSKFALYDNSKILILYTIDNNDTILLYDIYDDKKNTYQEINNMFIDINDNTNISKYSISLELSILKEDKVYINNSMRDLCIYKNDHNIIAIKGIEYVYDHNLKMFDKVEEIYSLSLSSYIINNNLCK